MRVLLLRHGATAGNLEKRYVGSTDESILPESAAALMQLKRRLYPEAEPVGDQLPGFTAAANLPHSKCLPVPPEIVCVSPLWRCRETASIVFPEARQVVIPDFRECDFGVFEYRNYRELMGNADYQRFIDSGGECGFPGGETKREFSERVVRAFLSLPEISSAADIGGVAGMTDNQREQMAGASDVAIVAHGGTIMAILDRFSDPHMDYFSWQIPCGSGYAAEWDGTGLRGIEHF